MRNYRKYFALTLSAAAFALSTVGPAHADIDPSPLITDPDLQLTSTLVSVCSQYGPVPFGYNLIVGTPANDVLVGTPGNDLIRGLAGNDWLYGRTGNDILCGNDGYDVLYGGPDNDRLYGGDGTDRLFGEGGGDQLYGEAGADAVSGGEGNDLLRERDGFLDDLMCGAGTDLFRADPGDTIAADCEGPEGLREGALREGV